MKEYLKMSDEFTMDVRCEGGMLITDESYYADIYSDGDLICHAINSHDELVEMNKDLLSLAERIVQWDIDYPVNCYNGYAGLKALDEIIRDNRTAIANIKGEINQHPNPLLDDVYVAGDEA